MSETNFQWFVSKTFLCVVCLWLTYSCLKWAVDVNPAPERMNRSVHKCISSLWRPSFLRELIPTISFTCHTVLYLRLEQ